MGLKLTRLVELFEGPDGKLSSTKVYPLIVILVLSGVLIATTINNMEPSSEIALILASLSLGVVGFNKFSDVKMAQAQSPTPVVTATVQGDLNVKPETKDGTAS